MIALVAALCWLIHWRGVALVGAGVVMLIAQRRMVDAVLFGGIAGMPAGLMLMVNRIMTGTFTGVRGDPYYRVPDLAWDYGDLVLHLIVWVVLIYAFGGLVLSVLQRLIAGKQPHDRI